MIEFCGGEHCDPSGHVLICTYLFEHFCRFIDYNLRFFVGNIKVLQFGLLIEQKNNINCKITSCLEIN